MLIQSYLLAGFVLLTIAAFYKSKTLRRFLGGRRIQRKASSHLDRNVYHQFHDLALPARDGSARITHLIVSKFGLFVIETLHMNGAISGKEYEPNWHHSFGNHTHAFQNPLRTCYQHIKALDTFLEVGEHKIFPVAAFAGDCTFEKEVPENVVNDKELVDYITSKTKVQISDADLAEILDQLKTHTADRSEASDPDRAAR